MARRPQVQTGTAGGCIFSGCLTLCVLALVAVVSIGIWLETQPGRDEAKARAALHDNVAAHQQSLSRAAADGILKDAEITQLFPRTVKAARGLVDIKKRAESTTIIAELGGSGPPRAFIFVYETTVAGCYAFHVPPPGQEAPQVSVRELADDACAASALPSTPTP
jgi:hypothetical protein